MSNYIVTNQVRCTECGDEPFSMHRHDYVSCNCRKTAVDGGQDYLKRVGGYWEEMSITIPQDKLHQLVSGVATSMDTGRNPLGVTLAALRAIRDADVVPVKKGGFTSWMDFEEATLTFEDDVVSVDKEQAFNTRKDEYIKTLEAKVEKLQKTLDNICGIAYDSKTN